MAAAPLVSDIEERIAATVARLVKRSVEITPPTPSSSSLEIQREQTPAWAATNSSGTRRTIAESLSLSEATEVRRSNKNAIDLLELHAFGQVNPARRR
jgi:hypothetical protein